MDNNDEFGLVDGLQDPYGLDNGSYLDDDATYLGGGEDMNNDLDGLGGDGGGHLDDHGDPYADSKANGNILDPNKSEAGAKFLTRGVLPNFATTRRGEREEFGMESMRTYFEKFGEVEDCVVMKDPTTSRSRGFGFLTFKDPRSVEEVVQLEHTLDGKIIDPKRAIPREEQEKTEKIFVGGVGPDVTEDQFRDYFMQFGKVIDATLMIDRETGRPRGFGFITFENSDGVDKAMAKQSMGELAINDKTVEVKRAMPKHKVPQTGGASQSRYGRPDSFGGGADTRSSGFGPMRSRMGFGGSNEYPGMGGMNRMAAARFAYPGGGMGYAAARYGGGADGGPGGGYGAAGFGYGMFGRYGGYGGMEGYPAAAAAAYGRNPAAMAAYYSSRGYGGGAPYGYAYPQAYGYGGGAGGGAGGGGGAGDMYAGRYGGSGGVRYLSEGGYRRGGEGSPDGTSPGRGGGGGRGYGSPGGSRREDDEGDSLQLAGGDMDVKPTITPSGPRFERDHRERDYSGPGRSGPSGGGGSGSGMRSHSSSHGYHPYSR
ncbi:hypothetical protein PhCBS80983_g00928 [Powellomyces hirtus]|uniref:RRM domain-containing protein n=1 Tax=Powellomyces hirtus TaxID=109895 RepID=A0A507EE21_9FUNG|nr:hypothetical protein PhCBS80983_g00928 [Powellomyces hirtus]